VEQLYYGVDRKMKGLFIGFDANGQKIYLDFKENPHFHIIGSTRTGKSKLLEWMIRQNIKKGEGFCLIDPHGFLYDDIVKWCAYHYFDEDIILLNPSEGDYINGFNPFRRSQAELSVQIDNQITVILRAWGATDSNETPSLERWLRCVLEAIVENDQTIIAAEYLIDFFEPEIREYLTSTLSKQLTRSDWKSASNAKTPKQFYDDTQILSTRNRLTRILTHPQVCRFMGMRENNIDIGKIMDEGKILLVNLRPSDHLSRQNSHFFGALLVNEFFEQAFRRKRIDGESPIPFYLYIDEFQNFVKTPDIGDMLDQVGKYGLRLILSHQRLGQIERENKDIIDALFTNVRNRAIFGGLTDETADFVVRNCFVNQLDLKQIKKAIYQTKFWPTYDRDKVYAHTEGSSVGFSTMSTSGKASSIHSAPPGEGWFDSFEAPPILSITDSESDIEGDGDFEGYSSSDSVIDIPIYRPVPFQELSSEEYWSLENQIWRMSESLRGQFQRHCFVQIPAQKTQPMLVPFVKSFYVSDNEVTEYERCLYNRTNALPKAEADMIIDMSRRDLRQKALESDNDLTEPETFRVAKQPVESKLLKRSKKV